MAPSPGSPADRLSLYRGAAVAVLMQWALRLVGLVSVFVLARLLTPADFGLVGLAAAALAFVELLGALGLRQALLRIPEPERAHLDTAFTIQLILFSIMGVAGLALAPLAARIYGDPALAWVVAALALRFFLLGLVNIGIVDFDRHLQFGRDLRMRLCSRLAALAVTLAAALLFRSYWALVAGLICQSGFHAIASWIVHPYRPRLSLARRAELLGVSLWMFAHTFAQTVQQQVERLALGRFGTAHLVGLFSVSKDLAEIFTQEIATALNRVTFVAVARTGRPLRENPGGMAPLLGAYAMIAAPMAFGLVATAEDAVRVLLGAQWVAAAPILEVVAIYSGLYAVYKVIASALQASGSARLVAFLSGGGALFLIACVAGAAFADPSVMTIAWAALAANATILLAGTIAMARVSGAGLGLLLSSIVRPFAAGALMLAAIRAALPDSGNAFVDLSVAAAFGAFAFPLFLGLLWLGWGRPAGAEAEGLRLLGEALRGLRARLSARFAG